MKFYGAGIAPILRNSKIVTLGSFYFMLIYLSSRENTTPLESVAYSLVVLRFSS